MKTFKEFLNEEVRGQYLYHNTSLINLIDIIDSGKLVGRGKWISFTRSKHYKLAPGAFLNDNEQEVTIIFDYEKLKRRNKTRPHADLTVVSASRNKLSQLQSKWESEERVNSPLKLDSRNGLIEIILHGSTKKKIQDQIDIAKHTIEFNEKQKEMLKQDKVWAFGKRQWIDITREGQRKVFTNEKFDKEIEKAKEDLRKYQAILDNRYVK